MTPESTTLLSSSAIEPVKLLPSNPMTVYSSGPSVMAAS